MFVYTSALSQCRKWGWMCKSGKWIVHWGWCGITLI